MSETQNRSPSRRRQITCCVIAALIVASAVPVHAQERRRPDVGGPTAAVVSDHPLASAAGAQVLQRGGNAMDAAITMAAVLAVVRPHMNGLGGDAFLLYRDARSGRVYALNGSGRTGAHATPAYLRRHGHPQMPQSGIRSATIPGAVRAWGDALARFGSWKWRDVFGPALRYAETGFPVSTELHADIAADSARLAADPVAAAIFLASGRPPRPGAVLRQAELARTLRVLAASGPGELYTGRTGRQVAAFVEAEGGLFTARDLAAHRSTWAEPISTTYSGKRVFAAPPNSQGVALLMQLNMAEQFDLARMQHNSAEYLHTLVEIKKLAFAERDRWVTDPEFARIPLQTMVSKEFARELLRRHGTRASSSRSDEASASGNGDTVYICVIDAHGNMVAMIQSLYAAFGSKRMVPGTGIVLHNRAGLFTLDSTHVNVIAPHKRPYHTLSPTLVLNDDGSPFMVVGTPGGDGQTQTVLQVLNNLMVFGMMPQQAVEAARYRSFESGRLLLDAGIGEPARNALRARGHDVRVQPILSSEMGGAQVIWVVNGMKITGADPRREAYGIAW